MKWKIHNFILKFFKLFISLKRIKFLEREFSLIQGKGYGAITIDEEINACRKLIGKHNVKNILDIGANKREYTKKLLKYYPNANYYLFEPSKFSSNILLKELKKFKNITIINKALSNKKYKDFLYFDKLGSGFASLKKRKLDHFKINFNLKEKIQITTFKNYYLKIIKNQNIDYCKIDAEGYELNILKGFKEIINKTKIIQFEFGRCNIDTKVFFQDFWYFFKKLNFDIYRIAPGKIEKIHDYDERDEYFLTTNFIAVNKNLNEKN